jgi:hypothetical protein
MLKRLSTLALTLAVAAPLSTASATGTQTYNVCGGTIGAFTPGFCASVQISVTAVGGGVFNLAMTVANLSGQYGSYSGAIFQNIGVTNIAGGVANPANILVSQDGATVCSNPTNNQTGAAGCWNVKEDQSSAGGFNIDFLANTSAGNNLALTSACSGVGTLNTCLSLHPVTISFNITTDFNPVTAGNLYIKAQGLNSTECVTGPAGSAELCTPITTTPEPATLALMGTGLFAMLPVFRRRRKAGELIES